MKPTVYIETTVVSYLTARKSKDVLRQSQMEITSKWWKSERERYRLFTSQFALDEAAAGDVTAAADRLAILRQIALLDLPRQEVLDLANDFIAEGALPINARVDALHL